MANPECQIITVHELKHKMDTEPGICLIDVREQNEWNEIRIPEAIHIPKDEISVKISAYMSDKNHPIYLHCRSGVRSLYAAQCLITLGYTNIYSVAGGIKEWAESGYPVQ